MAAFYAEGLHCGEVTGQALTEAKTGTPQFLLKVKILGTPQADGSYVPHQQQYERSIFMPLTEKTIPYVTEHLQQLGFTGTSVGQLDPSHPRHVSFVGKGIDLWCSYQDYQGKEQERWQLSKQMSQTAANPLDPKKVRQLDALFGKAFAGPKPETDAADKKPANGDKQYFAGDGTEITDDNIPF